MDKEFVYKKIIDYIKGCIEKGEFSEDQQLPTEGMLAKEFQTSRTTVVKALTELEGMGFIYRKQGKGSFVKNIAVHKKDELKIISLILPFPERDHHFSDEFDIIKGCESYLKKEGFSLMIHSMENEEDKGIEAIKKSMSEMVQGIILYTPADPLGYTFLYDMILDHYPIVCIDKNLDGLPVSCVQSDNLNGGYLAAKHLLEKEYERLFFVSDAKLEYVSSARDRYFGYCKALKEFHMPILEKNLINGYATMGSHYEPFDYAQRPQVFKQIWHNILETKDDKKIGIFASNDFVAQFLVSAALDMEIKIPEQAGIIGFDDVGYATIGKIPLTTIRQDYFKMGQVAAQTIVRKIKGQKAENNIWVEVELVQRSSTH